MLSLQFIKSKMAVEGEVCLILISCTYLTNNRQVVKYYYSVQPKIQMKHFLWPAWSQEVNRMCGINFNQNHTINIATKDIHKRPSKAFQTCVENESFFTPLRHDLMTFQIFKKIIQIFWKCTEHCRTTSTVMRNRKYLNNTNLNNINTWININYWYSV